MQRDLGLVREILLRLEPIQFDWEKPANLTIGEGPLEIEGYTNEQIAYHFRIMAMGDLISYGGICPDGETVLRFQGLRWQGHEFLDEVRDPEKWAKVKRGARAVGGVGIGFAIELAKAYAREKLGLPG